MEDHAGDVCAKAMRGHRIAPLEAARRAGLAFMDVDAVLDGRASVEVYRALAPVLHLDAPALVELAEQRGAPAEAKLDGLIQLNLPCDEMRVNVYLVVDPKSNEAIVFDTGAHPAVILSRVAELGCRVRQILLTHEHWDHVEGAVELADRLHAPVQIAAGAGLEGIAEFDAGASWTVGDICVRALSTPGHAVAGSTFVVQGLSRPLAVVGDALFAGSVGGARSGLPTALRVIRERILTLPPNTILAPGHGPLTTVEEELAHNPFFAH